MYRKNYDITFCLEIFGSYKCRQKSHGIFSFLRKIWAKHMYLYAKISILEMDLFLPVPDLSFDKINFIFVMEQNNQDIRYLIKKMKHVSHDVLATIVFSGFSWPGVDLDYAKLKYDLCTQAVGKHIYSF